MKSARLSISDQFGPIANRIGPETFESLASCFAFRCSASLNMTEAVYREIAEFARKNWIVNALRCDGLQLLLIQIVDEPSSPVRFESPVRTCGDKPGDRGARRDNRS